MTTKTARVLALGLVLGGCMDPDAPGNLVPVTVEDDPSLPRIEVNGTTLHAEAFGDPAAPMVLVLHGGPGNDYRYMLPMAALADDGYRVVFWDQRGAGLSRRLDASAYDHLSVYLEDLRQVIEHYSTSSDQPIVFLGQSWGAMYATWFINEYGDYGGRVVGAVLSEPGAFTRASLEDYIARAFPPWGLTSEELNDIIWSDQVMSRESHERADYLAQMANLAGFPREHDDPNNPPPTWRLGAVVANALMATGLDEGFDWTTHLGEFPAKVLFLRGELNENLPLADQQEKASHFARSELITVAGAGHDGIWDHPTEFLEHIRAYLAEVAPVTGGAR